MTSTIRGWSCCARIIAVLVSSIVCLNGNAQNPAENKKEVPPVFAKVAPEKIKIDQVVLLESPVQVQGFVQGHANSVLKREIIRQALLLTAREEFGLRTRDGVLGELPPDRLAAGQRFQISSILVPGKSQLGNAEAPDALDHEGRSQLELTQHIFEGDTQVVAGREAQRMCLHRAVPGCGLGDRLRRIEVGHN